MTSLRRLVDDVSEQGERLEQRLDDLSARLDALAAQLATRSNNSRGESGPWSVSPAPRKPNRRRKSNRSER